MFNVFHSSPNTNHALSRLPKLKLGRVSVRFLPWLQTKQYYISWTSRISSTIFSTTSQFLDALSPHQARRVAQSSERSLIRGRSAQRSDCNSQFGCCVCTLLELAFCEVRRKFMQGTNKALFWAKHCLVRKGGQKCLCCATASHDDADHKSPSFTHLVLLHKSVQQNYVHVLEDFFYLQPTVEGKITVTVAMPVTDYFRWPSRKIFQQRESFSDSILHPTWPYPWFVYTYVYQIQLREHASLQTSCRNFVTLNLAFAQQLWTSAPAWDFTTPWWVEITWELRVELQNKLDCLWYQPLHISTRSLPSTMFQFPNKDQESTLSELSLKQRKPNLLDSWEI